MRELECKVRVVKIDVEGYEYRLIKHVLDGGVLDKIEFLHVEDHCHRVHNLSDERNEVLHRVKVEGFMEKCNFELP
jgi:hypothetical protein